MPDIRIHREHRLGLARARDVAWQWAEEVEKSFDMECTVIESETEDTVEFERPGVKGQLIVSARHFELDAQLGFLLGAFRKTIEAEIERKLDELMAAEAPPNTGAAKPAKGSSKKPK